MGRCEGRRSLACRRCSPPQRLSPPATRYGPLALFEVGRVQPEIGPLAGERTLEEGVHPLIDVLAQLGNLRLADPRKPHRLHQVVHPPGRHAADPGLLNDRDQCFLRPLPGLQERRKIAALPQLRDAQLQRSKPGVQAALAEAVAPGRALAVALVAAGPDQAFDVGLHQQLQHRLRHAAQEIAFPDLLQKLSKRQSLLGHRVLSPAWVEVSQLHLSRSAWWPPPATPPANTRARIESPPHSGTLTLR